MITTFSYIFLRTITTLALKKQNFFKEKHWSSHEILQPQFCICLTWALKSSCSYSSLNQSLVKIRSCKSIFWTDPHFHERGTQVSSIYDYIRLKNTQIGDEPWDYRVKLGPKDRVTLQITLLTLHATLKVGKADDGPWNWLLEEQTHLLWAWKWRWVLWVTDSTSSDADKLAANGIWGGRDLVQQVCVQKGLESGYGSHRGRQAGRQACIQQKGFGQAP